MAVVTFHALGKHVGSEANLNAYVTVHYLLHHFFAYVNRMAEPIWIEVKYCPQFALLCFYLGFTKVDRKLQPILFRFLQCGNQSFDSALQWITTNVNPDDAVSSMLYAKVHDLICGMSIMLYTIDAQHKFDLPNFSDVLHSARGILVDSIH
jgi:hypothetical protein